jgi:hypothetical protein
VGSSGILENLSLESQWAGVGDNSQTFGDEGQAPPSTHFEDWQIRIFDDQVEVEEVGAADAPQILDDTGQYS